MSFIPDLPNDRIKTFRGNHFFVQQMEFSVMYVRTSDVFSSFFVRGKIEALQHARIENAIIE